MFRYDFFLIEPTKTQDGYSNLTNYSKLPFLGFSDKIPLNEELDSGVFTVLSTNSETLPIFSLFEMRVYEDNNTTPSIVRKYYVGQDDVTTQNKMLGDKRVYEHTIQVVELTKKLEKFVCEFYCFSQSYDANIVFYTLNDAIQRVMRIAPLGEDDIRNTWDYGQPYEQLPIPSDRAFDVVDSKISDIGNNEIPQLFLDQGTLREKLDAILKTINGISRLETYQSGGRQNCVKKLTVDLFNELKDILENLKLDNMQDDMTIEEINSNMETFLDNAVNEISQNSAQITYPSIEGAYDMLKPSDNNYVLSDNNAGIRTEYPIYRVDSLVFPMKIKNITYIASEGGTQQSLANITTDIEVVDRVIEEDDYTALPYGPNNFYYERTATPPETQSTYISYQYRSSFINCSKNFKNIVFTFPSFYTTILCAVAEYIKTLGTLGNSYTMSCTVEISGETIGHISFESSSLQNTVHITTEENFVPQNIRYRIKYTPIVDTHFSTDKNSTSQVKVNATSLENQSARIMSFENFSQNLLASSQRVGTQHREIALRHYKASELLQNGDYFKDTNEIITECEYIYYNKFIIGKYVLSKDYNRINEYIGINSEIRQWQVPGNAYDRKLLIKNYLEIDDNSKNNTSYLTELGCKTILDNLIRGGYEYTQYVYKATSCFYDTRDTKVLDEWETMFSAIGAPHYKTKLLLGTTNNGGGNVISLGFKFQDNMCAMPIVIEYNSKNLVKKVPYCIPNGDYMGFLRSFNFIISNRKADALYSNRMPFVIKRYETDNSMPYNDPNDLIVAPNMLVLKDPAEILNVNYQVSVVSNNDYITIGKWFAIDNALIKDYGSDTPLVLNVFTSTTRHGKTFNDRVNNDYVDTQRPISYYFQANCNSSSYDYSQTPNFNMTENFTRLQVLLRDRNIKEIVFADPDTKKIHLIIDVRYFGATYDSSTGNVSSLERNTIYFNFTKKRSNLNYDY